jgi:hypothetical protein
MNVPKKAWHLSSFLDRVQGDHYTPLALVTECSDPGATRAEIGTGKAFSIYQVDATLQGVGWVWVSPLVWTYDAS